MESRVHTLGIYRELADWYERRNQPPMRDRFLVLAADAAQEGGQPEEAERLRQRLLQTNPHHMLKPYSSFAQALEAPDVRTYVHDLKRNYPPEVAEELLRTLRASQEQTPTSSPPSTPSTPSGLEPAPKSPCPSKTWNRSRSTRLVTNWSTRPWAARPRPCPPNGGPPCPPDLCPALRQPPTASPRPPAPAPASAAPRPQPPAPRPAPPTHRATGAPAPAYVPEPQPPEPPSHGGAWLSVCLSVIVSATGLALAVYTLARPFGLP